MLLSLSVPPKKNKRKQDVKTQLPNLSNINMFHRPFPPQQKQITEEENQKRLEFYKNILGIKSVESKLGQDNLVLLCENIFYLVSCLITSVCLSLDCLPGPITITQELVLG